MNQAFGKKYALITSIKSTFHYLNIEFSIGYVNLKFL